MQDQSNPNSKRALSIVITLIVLGLIYFFASSYKQSSFTQENVKVTRTDFSTNARLPEGFPKDIPVEMGGIFDSIKSEFPDKGIVQYTVSYRTDKTVEEKFQEYLIYTSSNQYVLEKDSFDAQKNFPKEKLQSLYARRGDLTLSIAISKTVEDGDTTVDIAYIEKIN